MKSKVDNPHIIGVSGKTGAGKSTLCSILAKQLKATLISWDDYDDISTEPEDFIIWHQNGHDYAAFHRKALCKTLSELKAKKETIHPISNQMLPVAQFIVFDAPLGRLHQETGQYIDTMIHIEVPLDVLLCRRLLRDFKEQADMNDLLEELRFYLEQSRPLYFDEDLKESSDLVINGMLSTKQQLTDTIGYLVEKEICN